MFEGVLVIASTLGIVAARLTLGVVLVGVQFCVFKAGSRVLSGLGAEFSLGRKLRPLAFGFFVLVNIPLGIFLAESFLAPRLVIIYSPPIRLESLIRPISYLFFVWTIGSVLFVIASPILMGLLALIQFSERRRERGRADGLVKAVDLSRRRFVQLFLAGVATVPFAISAYGAVAAKKGQTVEMVEVPIRGLPDALDGVRIVQLSDIHAGLFMSANQIGEWARIANSLEADLIALTGDFVTTRTSEVSVFMKGVSGLRARYGVFGCLGNHDIGLEEVIDREFTKAGFVLLRNRNQYVDVRGAKLNLVGVDFIESHPPPGRRLFDLLQRIPLEGPTVLLCHNPNNFHDAARAGINLMLSGHFHGGQIALKIGDVLIATARLATMFVAGLFKIGDSHLYVNRGLGTTGPPIRINAPPEITVITLRTATS
ncbi:MAG: metallophosphoesterase [Blastocatellia bacterium]